MTITIVNGKGGSGKKTVSILLASALTEAGPDVAVLDTDPQRTASRWLSVTKGVQFAEARREYGAPIIDTPPRLESEVSEAVTGAIGRGDVIVLVTSPAPADVFTSQDTSARIKQLGGQRRAHVLFNQVQPGGTILAQETGKMVQRIGLPALRTAIHRRQCSQHAVMLGWRSLPGDAREEVLRAALEITALTRNHK